MASIRMDKQIFPFFDSVKTPITAAGISDSFHNAGFSIITIEVVGEVAGTVEGCINIVNPDGTTKPDEECDWMSLALIDLKDYSVYESIPGEGHYCIGINGMARVRVNLTSVSGESVIVGVAEA